MPNGKPGDHPITDLMIHHLSVYGEPLDIKPRQLGDLLSYHRLCDWFEQGEYWSMPKEKIEPIVAAQLDTLQRDAQDRGWENIT